eukprot:280421_1
MAAVHGASNPVKTVFVAATRQHVGKTTTCLAIMSGLKKRYKDVGFIKPVGQEHEISSTGVRVDKDVSLMKMHFNLHTDFGDMSPIMIPRGYTRDYIDGMVSREDQLKEIRRSYDAISKVSDAVILEGTGHIGVGSVVDLNNAQVAKRLNADMVLVANGGLGSAYDDLALNYLMCQRWGVNVIGIILNKVVPHKVEMIRDYFNKLLLRWPGVKLLGVIPDEPYLGRPTLMDLENIFKTNLMSGISARAVHHYSVKDMLFVATGLNEFIERINQYYAEYPLIVTHQTRNDIILGFLAHKRTHSENSRGFRGALVLTGRHRGGLQGYVQDMLIEQDVPVLLSRVSTFDTMNNIVAYTPKLNKDDPMRVSMAIKHYEHYIDFDLMLNS